MNEVVQEQTLPSGQKIQLVRGDLTQEHVDAIVNAANAHLLHGGGVAGAIIRRGGSQIQVESHDWVQRHGPVRHERPAFTSAGSLPSRYVIHAVGPVWDDGGHGEDEKLGAAVRGSLQVASELGCTSIALPAISTGIFGFPKERAARVILSTLRQYFQEHPDSKISLVRLTLLDEPTLQAFSLAWETS